MRKTKIICTIGPASEHEDVLTRMIKAGMDVARLNFSHGSHEEHQGKIDLIKKVRQKLHMPIAIMLDTKGPEYRIKTFENGKIELKDGDTFTLTTDDIVGNQKRVSVNYENLIKDLKVGDRVLVANGIIILQVRETLACHLGQVGDHHHLGGFAELAQQAAHHGGGRQALFSAFCTS